MTEKPSLDGVQSVSRAAQLILCFETGAGQWSLSDLARATGLHTSTAHRLLRTLAGEGILAQDERTGAYSLGPAMMRLARGVVASSQLSMAHEHLDRLATTTGAAASIGLRSGRTVVIAAAVLGPSFGPPLMVGERFPLHVSALGKVLMAAGAADLQAEIDALGPLESLTSRTITDRGRLRAELEDVSRHGFAVDRGEHRLDMASVAVSLLDRQSVVRAAIALHTQGPALSKRRADQLLVAVRRSSAAITASVDVARLA